MKYYIYHTASYFGMGSDVDKYLVSEKEAHEKWTEEEIHTMLTECHNYSGFNELVPLPEDIPVIKEHIHLDKTVFHIQNQFGFGRDIVVGEADFCKRIVDLTKIDKFCGFEGGKFEEFTTFSFKNVLEQHYMHNIKDRIKISKKRKKRCEDALKGIKEKQGYIDDFIDIKDETYKEWIREDEAILEKFSKPIEVPNDYVTHMYKGKSGFGYEYFDEEWKQEITKLSKIDYRDLVFRYPIGPRGWGGIFHEHRDIRKMYGLDEIFMHGADVKSRFYAHTGEGETLKDLEGIDFLCTIRDTFGYD